MQNKHPIYLSGLEGHCWSDVHCPAQTVVVADLAGAAGAALQLKGLSKLQGIGGKLEEDFISSRGHPVSFAATGPLGFTAMDQSSVSFILPFPQNPIVSCGSATQEDPDGIPGRTLPTPAGSHPAARLLLSFASPTLLGQEGHHVKEEEQAVIQDESTSSHIFHPLTNHSSSTTHAPIHHT